MDRERFGLIRNGPRLVGGPAQLTRAGSEVVVDGVPRQHLGRAWCMLERRLSVVWACWCRLVARPGAEGLARARGSPSSIDMRTGSWEVTLFHAPGRGTLRGVRRGHLRAGLAGGGSERRQKEERGVVGGEEREERRDRKSVV